MPFHKPIPEPSYVVAFSCAATAALDLVSLKAPAGKVLRLRRVVMTNRGTVTVAANVDWELGFATAVGSAGAAATVNALDSGDTVSANAPTLNGDTPAFGGVARTGDTTQAAGFTSVYPLRTISVPTTAAGDTPVATYPVGVSDERLEPLSVRGSSVIVLRTTSAGAGATGMRGYVEFTVEEP